MNSINNIEPLLANALDQLKHVAGERLVEPARAYRPALVSTAIVEMCSDQVQGSLTRSHVSGSGNLVLRGFGSEAHGSKLNIEGSNNLVFLGPYSRLQNADIRIQSNDNLFYFGAFSTVESMIVMLSGPNGMISIGDTCMLSARIIIDRSDHHSIYDVTSGQRINIDQDVTIDDHVWISRDVRISKGARIGRDAVIGQASIVAGQLAGGSIYGGVPAKCLRENITWSRMKADSWQAMQDSKRHRDFLARVEALKQRIASLAE